MLNLNYIKYIMYGGSEFEKLLDNHNGSLTHEKFIDQAVLMKEAAERVGINA